MKSVLWPTGTSSSCRQHFQFFGRQSGFHAGPTSALWEGFVFNAEIKAKLATLPCPSSTVTVSCHSLTLRAYGIF